MLFQRKTVFFLKKQDCFFASISFYLIFLICVFFLFSISLSAQTFPTFSQFTASQNKTPPATTQNSQTSQTPQTSQISPHPAVVRIIADEGNATTFGSGTLIGKKKDYGFVITNWHVVCDSCGIVKVRFPNRQEYAAAVIAIDDLWDLALLVIAEPKDAEPMPISSRIPNYQEPLWIAGYGSNGIYRMEGGYCTGFNVPQPNAPSELVVVSVPAEQGDSGGPVMNQRKELAGVLFGSDETQTTMASHCGRVVKFTQEAAKNFSALPAAADVLIRNASQSRQTLFQRCAEQIGIRGEAEEYVNVPIDPYHASQSSSSASSFGGVRARRNQPTAQSQQLVTRRKMFGFLNVRYDTIPQTNSPDKTAVASAIPSAKTPLNNGTAANNSNHVANNPNSKNNKTVKGYFNPLPPSAVTANNLASNNVSANHVAANNSVNSQNSYSQNVSSQNFNSASANTAANSAAYPPYSSTAPNSSTAPTTFASNSHFTTTAPTAISATPSPATASQTTALSTTATLDYSLPSKAAAEKNGNSQNNAAANLSPQTTNTPSNNGQKTPPSQPSRRKTPSVESFNTYSQNNSITPHPATVSAHLTDSELAAQYSLDENEMLNDELAPKYAENYAAESVPLTASLSKLDAVKIVIAILVIFFILFHTIKNMAIAEESEHAA